RRSAKSAAGRRWRAVHGRRTGPGGQGLREKLGLTPELDEKLRYSATPKGLPGRDMTEQQRQALVRVIGAYLDHLADGIAGQYAVWRDPGQLGDAAFAWAGPIDPAPNAPIYYRVQSERLLIEYDCT